MVLLAALLAVALVLPACGDDDDDDEDDATDDDDDDATDDDDDDNDDNDDDDTWDGLRVGAVRVDISPTESVIMGGYGTYFFSASLCRWSEGIHDPLFATAMAFQDGDDEPVIQIVLDTVGIVTTDVLIIQQMIAEELGIGPERVVISATHNHQSPDIIGIWGVMLPPISGRDDAFIDQMIAGAVEAAVMAYDDLQPARAFAAVGEEDRFHYNAQHTVDWNVPLDSIMTGLVFTGLDGEMIGTLVNWACHPMIMGPQNTQISADFLGPYYRVLDEEIGGVNMFVNGNLGAGVHPQNDEHPINYTGRTWGSWELVEYYGRGLAASAKNLLATATPITDTSISLRTLEFEGELRNPFFALIGLLDLIPRDIPPLGGTAAVSMTAWRLGPVLFTTAPGEVSPRVGLELREIMGGEYQVIANIGQDWLGYIMTEDEYRNLLYIYFTILSAGPGMGEALTTAYEEILLGF